MEKGWERRGNVGWGGRLEVVMVEGDEGRAEGGKEEEGDAVKLNYIARVEWVNRGLSNYFGIGARM